MALGDFGYRWGIPLMGVFICGKDVALSAPVVVTFCITAVEYEHPTSASRD